MPSHFFNPSQKSLGFSARGGSALGGSLRDVFSAREGASAFKPRGSTKINLLALFCAAITEFCLVPLCFTVAEEIITLTTYYPAPYGMYKNLYTDGLAVGSAYRNETLSDGMLIVQDRVGIGVATPQNLLDIEGGMVVGRTYAGSDIAPVNGLIVEGRLGVNTTAPGTELEVNGQVKITGGSPVQDAVLTSDATGLASWKRIGGLLDVLVVSNWKSCSWWCTVSVSCPVGYVRTGCGKGPSPGTMRTSIVPEGADTCTISSNEGIPYNLTAYAICVR